MKNLLCTAALFLTLAGSAFAQAPPNPPGPPTPPPTTLTVQVSWQEATAGTTFNVYRWTSGENGFAKINTAPITALTYSDPTAVVGTAYTYRVTAVNSAGESAQSADADITVTAPIVIPAIPNNVKVTVVITN